MAITIADELSVIRYYFGCVQALSGKEKEPQIYQCCGPTADPRVKHAFRFLLDPGCVTHVGKKSFQKKIALLPNKGYASIFDIIEELMSMPAVNDQTLANIHASLRTVDDLGLRLFGYAFLCKDISLGVTAKTVNKALGFEFIPEFRCMLANKYFEHPDKVEGKYFYLTEKLDGIRCLAVVKPDGVRFYSRQGQPIDGLFEIEADLIEARKHVGKDFVLDGELLVSNRDQWPSKEQYKKTTNIVRRDGPKSGVTFNVFDVLDAEAFAARQCHTEYWRRRQLLAAYIHDHEHVKVLPILYHGTDTDKILEHLAVQRHLNHEGVMINLADEPYQFTRTNALLKVKVMQDCDLPIVGVQEGNGKFAGTLGALVVDYKGNQVGVGSGISDALRREIWNNPAAYIGRVATIQYFEETNDVDGKLSIRFPVFKELREEGKDVSYT